MATSAGERVRCALCGKFVTRGVDAFGDDWDAEERAYESEGWLENHDCEGFYRDSVSTGSRPEGDALGAGYGLDLVGLREVAVMLGVQDQTVRQWRARKVLPPAIEMTAGPVWPRKVIERWSEKRQERRPLKSAG